MVEYYDNSMISEYKRCPRRYYFRHVREWAPTGIALAPTFGLCWHQAMDGVWATAAAGKDKQSALEAGMLMFMEEWRANGLPAWEDMDPLQNEEFSPRTPGVAAEMLHHYIEKRWDFIKSAELLAVERPFAVPIYPNRTDLLYIGRLDKVIHWDGIWGIEHKTTSLYSKSQIFRETFIESFSPNSQIDGYSHGLHMTHGQKVRGVMVDGALVHKQVHDGFKFIPVMRSIAQLDSWLWEVREWIERIRTCAGWAKDAENRKSLQAFPKNDSACFDFNKPCPYLDVCRGSANPATVEDCPPGLVKEKWEPFELKRLKEVEHDSRPSEDGTVAV